MNFQSDLSLNFNQFEVIIPGKGVGTIIVLHQYTHVQNISIVLWNLY